MLITKNFIVINNPKTGSSFVREVLKEIYQKRAENASWLEKMKAKFKTSKPELIEHFVYTDVHQKHLNQHGRVSQIPKKFADIKNIVSVIRNPYSRLLSHYEFGWWKENYHLYNLTTKAKNAFPHFPNLSLDEYIEFNTLYTNKKHPHLADNKIGQQTRHFIQMFFNRPGKVFRNLNDDYILSGAYRKELRPITFLQQENLTEDLISFLSQYDFTAKELDLIRNYKKVNVTKSKTSNRMALHTPKSLDYIQTYERLLFKIYEDLGIFYEAP